MSRLNLREVVVDLPNLQSRYGRVENHGFVIYIFITFVFFITAYASYVFDKISERDIALFNMSAVKGVLLRVTYQQHS
ncbi:hypothetical protein Lal_00013429 [Lupinus albus]|nr:hypothetical protein Lal_00013429 [Lupinus albus]